MDNKTLTPEESLKVISDMIAQSRRKFEKNCGMPLLISGIIVCSVAAATYMALHFTGNPRWNFLWFACAIIFPVMELQERRRMKSHGKTILDAVYGYIWAAYGIMAILHAALCLLTGIPEIITICNLAMLGLSSAITGLVMKNNVITICGFLTGIASVVLCNWITGAGYALLICGAAFLNLVVPGIWLNICGNKE